MDAAPASKRDRVSGIVTLDERATAVEFDPGSGLIGATLVHHARNEETRKERFCLSGNTTGRTNREKMSSPLSLRIHPKRIHPRFLRHAPTEGIANLFTKAFTLRPSVALSFSLPFSPPLSPRLSIFL